MTNGSTRRELLGATVAAATLAAPVRALAGENVVTGAMPGDEAYLA